MVREQRQVLSDVRDTDIVVGVDGSESSKAALRWAVKQARLTGARIQALTAWEYPPTVFIGPVLPYVDLAAVSGKLLRETVDEVIGESEPDTEVRESVVAGHPAQMLVDASARAGLLVVGSRGHGTFAGALIGSVSQQCVSHADCPVVVVRGKG